MQRKLIPAAIAATALLLPPTGHAQTTQTFNGNGQSGFSGFLGLGSLTVSQSTAGDVTFSLTGGGPNGPTLNDNGVAVYIDSVTGGFADTSQFSDNGDAGHEIVSGANTGTNPGINGGVNGNPANLPSRSLVTFAPNFGADYALSFESGYVSLFKLAAGGDNSLIYVTGAGQNGAPLTLTVTSAQLGLSSGQGFSFAGTLISGTSAFRSNESLGDIGAVTSNPGFNGGITFNNFNTFGTPAAAPEPGGMVSLLMGALVLGGLVAVRRRRRKA